MPTLNKTYGTATLSVTSTLNFPDSHPSLLAFLDSVWEFVGVSPLASVALTKPNGFYSLAYTSIGGSVLTNTINLDSPTTYQLKVSTTDWYPSLYYHRTLAVREALLPLVREVGVTSLTITWA